MSTPFGITFYPPIDHPGTPRVISAYKYETVGDAIQTILEHIEDPTKWEDADVDVIEHAMPVTQWFGAVELSPDNPVPFFGDEICRVWIESGVIMIDGKGIGQFNG